MCELGVLRKTTAGHFVMRSTNVIGLLGSEEDILATLCDAEREGPNTEFNYEASTFRRVYDQHTKWRRSPLTAEQESRLHTHRAMGCTSYSGPKPPG